VPQNSYDFRFIGYERLRATWKFGYAIENISFWRF